MPPRNTLPGFSCCSVMLRQGTEGRDERVPRQEHLSLGSVGPQAQSLPLCPAASRGCRHCSGTSLHGFRVTSSSHSSQCAFWEAEPFPRCSWWRRLVSRSITGRCHVGARAEAIGCLLKISLLPPLPPASADHRVHPSGPPTASGGERWAEQDGASTAPCPSTSPGGWGGPTAPCISRTPRWELSQPRAGLGEVMGSSRGASMKPQRRHHVHPGVPTPPRRLPRAFPSPLAATEQNRQHVQAGRRQWGRQQPPALAQHFCSGQDNPGSASKWGTREEPVLCFPSDARTPRLLSLPSSVHCTRDRILSLLAGRALFLLPSKKKKPTNPTPSPVPQAPVQRALCKGREQLWKSLILRLISPRSPPGAPSCCQRCLGRLLGRHSPANRGESPSLSALTENPAFFFLLFFPVFPESLGKKV